MQKRIYFDITDILEFASHSHRVTGIQRVQLRLISNIIKKHGSITIKGAAYNRTLGEWQELDLAFLATMDEFDALDLLFETGRLHPSRLPPKNQVKKYLAPYNNQKIWRGLKKASLYIQSYISPRRTSKKKGLIIYWIKRERLSSPPVPLALSSNDTLAMLGANWTIREPASLAHEHSSKGGHVVQMMYDLIPYCRPEFHTEDLIEAFNEWLEETPGYTSTYLCISEATAVDLRQFLETKKQVKNVFTTPLAHEFTGYARNSTRPLSPKLHEITGKNGYVLCVGSIEIRKNGEALVRAWEKVQQALGDATPTLLFAGKKAWKISDFEATLKRTNSVHGTVKVYESPSDKELASLYSNCLFTVYPSLYEGWGLPVGESAWLGKFAVVSTASSVPEVCGDLMDYLDPTDLDNMVSRILHPLQDRAYLLAREQEIRNSPLRTWEDVADDVYQHLHAPRDASLVFEKRGIRSA